MRIAAFVHDRLTLVGALGSLFLLVCVVTMGTTAWAAETPAGYLDAVRGEVTATQPSQGRRTLGLEDKVFAHDVVATGPGAAARIVFRDKSVLEIKESSQVALVDFAFAKQGEKAMTVKFAVGVFRMITGEIVKANPDKFKVESPLSVIGIRGTDFASQVGRGSELHALFSSGTPIDVRSGGREQSLDRPDFGVEVTSSSLGAPRPLTEAEKKLFARTAFTRQMDMNRLQMLLRINQGITIRPPVRVGHP